jgi:hypothetical protein
MADEPNPNGPPDQGWQPYPPVRNSRRAGVPWLIAAVAMAPLAMLLLFAALMIDSIALVYVSILASVLAVPFVIVGVIRLRTSG